MNALQDIWDRAERELAESLAALDTSPKGLPDEQTDRLVDRVTTAQHLICRLPPATMAHALRRIEIAVTDGVLSGVDLEELITEAKGLLP